MLRLKIKVKPLPEINKIKVHFVRNVKHDINHKARLTVDNCLTEVPLSRLFPVVVSLKGVRSLLSLAELKGL